MWYNKKMSMAPKTKEDASFKPTIVQTIKHETTQALSVYFADPIHYIFYGLLTAIAGGLFFGVIISWQLYAILGVVGAMKAYSYFKKP